MSREASKKDLAVQFLKTSVEFRSNRCEQCGRRLKLQPGATLALGSMPRFTTCRSCGYENPTIWEKVAEDLIAAGFSIPSIDENVTDLGECLGCGVELQVSKDFTKVFCNRCGREWDRFEFEDLMGRALSPMLAGKNAIKFDTSKTAKALEELLEKNDFDSSNPYLVIKLKEKQAYESMSFGKGMLAAIKAGIDEEKERQKSEKKKVENLYYLALYDDYTAFYEYRDEEFDFKECAYEEMFSGAGDTLELPFSQDEYSSSSMKEYFELLGRFEVIHNANRAAYKKELFGTALKEAEAKAGSVGAGSLVDELQKLADLKSQGLLTDEEFAAAKAVLLNK